jgi:peptidoglycan/LPS O-acetylase OafA/YrhL
VKRIPSLDGLRAISIIFVVLSHMSKSGHAPRIFFQFAATGVSIFFVISGYLITSILLREREHAGTINLREFYIRRAYRIFPAAFVFMAVAIVVFWPQFRWYHIAAGLLYVANYDLTRPWVFGHLWSLSIEEQFYFLWPGVLKLWYRHRVAIVVGVLLSAPLWKAAMLYFKARWGLWAFPALADNLAIGCLLAVFAPRLPRVKPYWAVVMAVAAMGVQFFPAENTARTLLLLFVLKPIFYISIAGVLLHVVQTPYRSLNWGPVVWLGQISYSLYLWQEPFCADRHMRSGYLVFAAIACACLSYYFIERPMLRVRERRSLRAATEISTPGLEASPTAA